jgi:hypothetical protein
MINYRHLLILGSFYLYGCAHESPIQKVSESKSYFDGAVYSGETTKIGDEVPGAEKYRVFHQAATGVISVQTVREESEERAKKFCEYMGNVTRILQETVSKPPHVLGNFPRAEIIFSCIDKPTSASYEDPLYIKLTNLKKLLDNGVISKEEFEQQKVKILNN